MGAEYDLIFPLLYGNIMHRNRFGKPSLNGTSAMGNCVRPTPDTSTLNWAKTGSAGEAARAAIKVRRAVNDE